MNFFERTYVVNLPQRTDRRRMIVQELDRVGMPLTPKKTEIFPAIRPDDAQGFPSIGARGCFLSHLTILKQAQEDQLANVLILEDDLTISEQFIKEQEALVERLQQGDWDFVYFGYDEKIEQKEETEGTSLVRLEVPFGPIKTTHFYGLNGKTLDQLILFLEELQQRPGGHPDGGPMHLDGAYATFRSQNPHIVTLIAIPKLGWQRSSHSDIHPKWFSRVPILRELADVARSAKGRFKS